MNLKKGYLFFHGNRKIVSKNKLIEIGSNFEKDIEEILKGFFYNHRERIIFLLEQIINQFSKNNIKCSIVQTYDHLVERIIIQYHFLNKSKCFYIIMGSSMMIKIDLMLQNICMAILLGEIMIIIFYLKDIKN